MAERDALGWARDILIVLILLAILAGIVVAILNIGTLFKGIGSLLQPGGNNQGYYNPGSYNQGSNQGNYNPNQGNYSQNNYNPGGYNQSSSQDPLSIMGANLKSAMDKGDWSAASDIMGTIDSMSSQLPPEVQSLLSQFDEAVRNHDQAAFNSLYASVQASSQSNTQNYNQTYNNNQPTSEWCIPGVYGGNAPNIPAESTILGMTEHDGRQMCRITYQASEQGMNIDGDCYIDDSQVCCAVTIAETPLQQETCVAR